MKSTCGGTRLEFKTVKRRKIFIQNLTRLEKFLSKSKSDALYFFRAKI